MKVQPHRNRNRTVLHACPAAGMQHVPANHSSRCACFLAQWCMHHIALPCSAVVHHKHPQVLLETSRQTGLSMLPQGYVHSLANQRLLPIHTLHNAGCHT